jgi:hypothetical protein
MAANHSLASWKFFVASKRRGTLYKFGVDAMFFLSQPAV